jgi:addiction module HigA family antidote
MPDDSSQIGGKQINHPGAILEQEFMRPAGLTQNRLARALGIPAQRVGDIVLGRRGISPDTAVRLARYFANDPRFWFGLQMEYDLARVDLEHIKREVRCPENQPGRAQRQIDDQVLREHQLVAERLRANPAAVIAKARENIERWGWLRDFPDPARRPGFMTEWLALLDGPLDLLLSALTGSGERMVTLRSSSPFAGVVSFRERWRLRRQHF